MQLSIYLIHPRFGVSFCLPTDGGNKWTRTINKIAYVSSALFPVSLRTLVGTSGLEPPTSRLSGVCSNQLSYVPILYWLAGLIRSVRFIQPPLYSDCNGGGKRDRTADPLLARQVLSQLSYTPKKVRLGLTENKCPDFTEHYFIKNE